MWLAISAILKPILSFLKVLPWWVWAMFLALAMSYFYGEFRYREGMAEVQSRWDAATTKMEQEKRELETKQSEVTVKTVIKYVDRVREVRVKGDTIIKRVPEYVPSDSCDLPPGFRLLHDAAASGSELPEAAGSIQAEPVPAKTAAETVVSNYTECRAELEKLNGLWDWSNGVAGSSGGSR